MPRDSLSALPEADPREFAAIAQEAGDTDVISQAIHLVTPQKVENRFATPDEVGAVVAFVRSPLASAINGTALRADGELVRSIA